MSISVIQGTSKDVPTIERILASCQKMLQASGSPQWSEEDAPKIATMVEAIDKGLVYLLLIEETVVGTAILTKAEELAYNDLQYGQWEETEGDYYSIHRFAIDPTKNGRGYATLFFNLLTVVAKEKGAKDIRVDTHPVNKAMQKVILNSGYEFKGIVHLPVSHGERYAYQKIL